MHKVTAEPMLDPSGEPLKVQPGMEGVAQTQADMAVGPMLLELYNLGAIEEAELRRRLQGSSKRGDLLARALRPASSGRPSFALTPFEFANTSELE